MIIINKKGRELSDDLAALFLCQWFNHVVYRTEAEAFSFFSFILRCREDDDGNVPVAQRLFQPEKSLGAVKDGHVQIKHDQSWKASVIADLFEKVYCLLAVLPVCHQRIELFLFEERVEDHVIFKVIIHYENLKVLIHGHLLHWVY